MNDDELSTRWQKEGKAHATWDPMLEVIKENSRGFWSVLLLDDQRMIGSVRRGSVALVIHD